MPANTSCASSTTHRSKGSASRSAASPVLAADELAPDHETRRRPVEGAGPGAALAGLDAEQRVQLLPPLPEQRLRRHQQDAARPRRSSCAITSPASIVFPEPDLVGQDAAAVRQPRQREHHRVDLVRVRVDASGALRRHVAALLVGAPQADQLLGEIAALDRVRCRHFLECILTSLLWCIWDESRFLDLLPQPF